MIVKTRNYRLEKNLYIKMALKSILLKQWWAVPIAVAICLLYFLDTEYMVDHWGCVGIWSLRTFLAHPVLRSYAT